MGRWPKIGLFLFVYILAQDVAEVIRELREAFWSAFSRWPNFGLFLVVYILAQGMPKWS